MTIHRVVIDRPRAQVSAQWLMDKQATLAVLGLRIVAGCYYGQRIRLIAVKAGR